VPSPSAATNIAHVQACRKSQRGYAVVDEALSVAAAVALVRLDANAQLLSIGVLVFNE